MGEVEARVALSSKDDRPDTRLEDGAGKPLLVEAIPPSMNSGASAFFCQFVELFERPRNENPKPDREDPIASRAMYAGD
jgi:hypothetical protein